MFDVEVTIRAQGAYVLEMELVGHIDIHDIIFETLHVRLLKHLSVAADTVGVDALRMGREVLGYEILVIGMALRTTNGIGVYVRVDQEVLAPHFIMARHAEMLIRRGVTFQ